MFTKIYNALGDAWAYDRAYRGTYNELSRLSPRELKDVGIYSCAAASHEVAESAVRARHQARATVKENRDTSAQREFPAFSA